MNIMATRTTFGLSKPRVISVNNTFITHAHNVKHRLFISFYNVMSAT
jgi:hypothetical protein